MKYFKTVFLFFLLFMVNSCAEKLDFNQIDNFVLKPVYSASLTNLTLLPWQFFNTLGVQQSSIEDVSNFEVFQDPFIRNNVVKVDFYAAIKNDFDRAVTINIDFLDDNNNLVYRFNPIQVSSKDLNFTYLEEIDLTVNPSVRNTLKVRIEAELENTGTSMNPNSLEEFQLKSSVTVYIESKI